MKSTIYGIITTMLMTVGSSCAADVEIDNLVKAAERGSKIANYDLGVMHSQGNGVKEDREKANKYYRTAAKMGYAPAQNNLGWSYRQGLGVKKNPMLAIYWFRLAALQQNALALQNLAEMFQNGEGVVEDLALANDLYTLCATLPIVNEGGGRESGFNNAILECRRELGKLILNNAKSDQNKLKLAAFWIRVSYVINNDVDEDSEIGVRARRTKAEIESLLSKVSDQLTPESTKWIEESLKDWDAIRFMFHDRTSFPLTELDCGNYRDL